MKKIPFPVVQGILILLMTITAAISTTSNPVSSVQPTPTHPLPSVLASTPVPGLTSTPAPQDIVRLAWFYKPPDSTQMDLVAQQADFFILTHKDENERATLQQKGITTPFSQYLLFTEIHDPGDCEDGPTGNQVAFKEGDFCEISQSHPDWFLLEADGDRVGDEDSYFMDPGSEGFRAFWLERARELQETHGWENIFLDNVEASRAKFVENDEPLARYPDDESYQEAVEGFLNYIRENYFQPRGKPVYANIVSVDEAEAWDAYLQYLDGVMIESFATDWDEGYLSHDDWEAQIEQAERALSVGKTLILVAQGQQEDHKLQNFAFASYLLIANGNAYFRYANSDAYRDWWMYENYNQDPGVPVGPRYESQGGWRRDFRKGYVIVRPQDREAEIVITSP